MSTSVYRNATPDNEDGEHDKDVAVHGVPPVLHMVPLLNRHLARVPDGNMMLKTSNNISDTDKDPQF